MATSKARNAIVVFGKCTILLCPPEKVPIALASACLLIMDISAARGEALGGGVDPRQGIGVIGPERGREGQSGPSVARSVAYSLAVSVGRLARVMTAEAALAASCRVFVDRWAYRCVTFGSL